MNLKECFGLLSGNQVVIGAGVLWKDISRCSCKPIFSDQCPPRWLAVNKLSFVSNTIGFHSTFSIYQIFDTVFLCLWNRRSRRHCFLIILLPLSSLNEWTHFHCNLMQTRSKCGERSCFLSRIIETMTSGVKLRVYLFFSIWLYLAGPPSVCEKLISLHPSFLEHQVHCKNHNWLKCGFNFLHNS